MKKGFRLQTAVLCFIYLMVVLGVCGCTAEHPYVQIQPEYTVVYDDGVYKVEAEPPVSTALDDGSCRTDFRLKITNGSLEDAAISSVLGAEITSPVTECRIVESVSADPIDGLIRAGESAEGNLSVITSVAADSFIIKLAVDYLNDQWISFEITR